MNSSMHMFWNFFAVVILTSLLGNAIGMFIGNISSDHKTTVQFMPLFFVPYLILAGFLVNTGIHQYFANNFHSPVAFYFQVVRLYLTVQVHYGDPDEG